MNTTTFKRKLHNKDTPFALISQTLLQDRRLSIIAIGIMSFLLSNANNYVVYVDVIKNIGKLTDTQFSNAWKMLQKYKYIETINKGRGCWHIIINEYGDLRQPLDEFSSGGS